MGGSDELAHPIAPEWTRACRFWKQAELLCKCRAAATEASEWIRAVRRSAKNLLTKTKNVESLLTQLQLKPTLQMGQVENNARYLGQMGMRTLEDLDVGETSNSCWAS